jgi:uncharacterized protein
VQTDTFDLSSLQLSSGGGRRLELDVAVDGFGLAGERYGVHAPGDPAGSSGLVPVTLDVSKTTGNGYALKLRFEASLVGPCMRCLEPAAPVIEVEVREIQQPGEREELDSPYLERGVLDIRSWVRDALALSLPVQLLCRPDCAGLCPVCGDNLNTAAPGHAHESPPDPRWAKLSEIRFD